MRPLCRFSPLAPRRRSFGPRSTSVRSVASATARLSVFFVLAGLLGIGCVTATPQADRLAYDLERDLALQLEPQHGVKLGRLSLGLARSIARVAVDEEDGREALAATKGIKRVEISSYLASGAPFGRPADLSGSRVERAFSRGGWLTLARYREENDIAWVLYRLEREELRNLVVLALDGEELTIVRLSGRLDRVVEAALDFARREVERERWRDDHWIDDEDLETTTP